jgi:hypothetical protein
MAKNACPSSEVSKNRSVISKLHSKLYLPADAKTCSSLADCIRLNIKGKASTQIEHIQLE